MNSFLKYLLLLCTCFQIFSALSAQQSMTTNISYIRAGKIFDAENGEIQSGITIKIEGNKVIEVGPEIKIPDSANVIDLTAYTVLPGLIDGHTHVLSLEKIGDNHSIVNDAIFHSDGLRSLRGAKRAETWLKAGFTTIRDLGNSGQFLDVGLKTAINEGTVEGPRMYVSGPIIASEGGQVVGLIPQYSSITDKEYRVVRGVEDAINAVRENVLYGADIIKICANNTPNNTTLTIDEMKAIVKMAHRYNKKVTAHATNDKAVWEATVAGVDGIEHGYQISDSTLALMAEKGVALIPTDISTPLFHKYVEILKIEGDTDRMVNNAKASYLDRLQRAIKAGVTIVTGSDNYLDFEMPQGEAAKNILLAYEEEGMKPLDILRSSTYLSARFMDMEDQLGVIKEGAFADIIAVRGDVEKEFSKAMFDVVFIMKDGKIYFEEK